MSHVRDDANGDRVTDELAGAAVGALIPLVGDTLGKRLMRRLRAEWHTNASTALAAAEKVSGMSREDLAETLENDPRAVPLYMRILWVAAMNGHDDTLSAMGVAFGEAASASARGADDAFEDAELALRAMSELGPRHFRVLFTLSQSVVIVNDGDTHNYSQFMPDYVAERTGLRVQVTHQCLLNLAAAGLAYSVSVFDGTAYPITDLGQEVARAVRIHGGH